MRRKDREVQDFEQIIEIIETCDTIRLGLSDGDYPYIVPMNFGYEIIDGQIYFYIHGAQSGRKIDLIKRNQVCSFEMDCSHLIELLPERGSVTMRYKCLMGKAKIDLLDGEEKQHGIDVLMNRYEETKNFNYSREAVSHTMTARLAVTEYSGKVNAPY